jgi:hypothetical protein
VCVVESSEERRAENKILHVLRRSARALTSLLRVLRLVCAAGTVLIVQPLFLDVFHYGLGHQVADTHVSFAEQADLCARNVILHQLLYNVNIVLPLLQRRQGFVNISTASLLHVRIGLHEGMDMVLAYLDDESAKVAQDVVDILRCPNTGSRHRLNQICTSEQGNLGLLGALRSIEGSADCVDLVLKVVEHLCCLEVVFVKSLPWVHCRIKVRYSSPDALQGSKHTTDPAALLNC